MRVLTGLTIPALLAAPAARAELLYANPDAMLIRHEYRVAASAAKTWESLLHPERWWPAEHTWSGRREALSLAGEAGGCFCERWDGGGAVHGRVVMAQPGKLLRLEAALGPLQEMAVTGVLSVHLAEQEGTTTVTVNYRVSGDPMHRLDGFAAIVDPVVGLQFSELAAEAARP